MLFFDLIVKEQTKEDGCATVQCRSMAKQARRAIPRASHYHTSEQSWVCFTCAQRINRGRLGTANKYLADYKPVCISSEDYLVGKLTGQYK